MLKFLYSLATDKRKGLLASAIKIILSALAQVYAVLVKGASFICALWPYQASCRIISVGNITLGGTGKTPLVELLALKLKEKGRSVAVLTRGYKKADEALMLRKNLGGIPVIVDKNRIRSAKKAVQEHAADTLILDDGFQQWRIKKDLEIVTINTLNPLGNLRLLPRGILRQPLSSLRRADIFVLTKVNLSPASHKIKAYLREINPSALIVEAAYRPEGFSKLGESSKNLIRPEEFRVKKIGLVCGIADPASFEGLIKSLGIDIGLSCVFSDHHAYTQKDLARILREARQKSIETIVISEKDAVCFPDINQQSSSVNFFVLRIKIEILQNEAFLKRIYSLF